MKIFCSDDKKLTKQDLETLKKFEEYRKTRKSKTQDTKEK